MKRPNILITLVVVMLAVILPYGLAALLGGREQVFIGFLLNPADGASYLAKMYQGWAGSWRFVLPFTAEPGNGAYLFLYYLFLGHVARWPGLPLGLTFHLARLLGAGALLLALIQFYDHLFRDRPDLYRIAYWLTVVGSGLGWLVVLLGVQSSDFWVAEAYPFLSMYANPHFPLGLALLLWTFLLVMDPGSSYRSVKLLLLGLLISIIFPFALVVSLLVSAAALAWTWRETGCLDWKPLVSLGLLGGPFLLYQFWAAQVDPVLSGWNAQNLTPSPPLWDFLLSFSPALLLAPLGLLGLLRAPRTPARRMLVAWFILSLILIYFPFPLQRRFMLGFYIPTAALAVFGLDDLYQVLLPGLRKQRKNPITAEDTSKPANGPRSPGGVSLRRSFTALMALALPTNILLILIGFFGILSHSPLLYMTGDESRALAWLQQNTPAHALVLASPDMGRLIPAFTGRRVLYGHPFETVNAAREESQVTAFYASRGKIAPDAHLLTERNVDYLFDGPREQSLGGNGLDLSALRLAYRSGPVQIFAVKRGR